MCALDYSANAILELTRALDATVMCVRIVITCPSIASKPRGACCGRNAALKLTRNGGSCAVRRLEVKDLMQTDLQYLPPVATVGEMVDTLRSCKHQAFPLVTGRVGRQALRGDATCYALQGVISRRALLSLLEYRGELVEEEEVRHQPCT